MNVRKRGLALLMCICMIFTLLPFSALADATTQDDGIVYGKYDDTGWHEDKTLTAESSVKHYPASGETSDNKANIDYSKTAVKNDDGSYSVTLTIKSKTSETAPGASAVVLVIDNSNSMTDDRLNSAKAAAKAFVDSYGKSGSGRYIALVSFADYAKKYDFSEGRWPWRDKVYWLDASNADNRRAITASIDKMGRNGGTNFEQGLSAANDLLKDGAVYKKISKDNKFAIALTDGQPTYYGNGWPTPSGTGKSCNEATYNKTIEAAKTLKSNAASLYTVCYGAASDVIDWNNETVGDFLANRIASPGEAYNATDSENSLSEAFAKIYESIKHGISSGFTVTDPMGEYVNLVSDSLTGDGYSVSGSTITWKPKNGTTVENTDGSKTTTYTLTYKVTLGEVPEDGTYPLNKDTTLEFKDGDTEKTLQFNVPGVKGTAPRYTVTYKPGDHGTLTGADNNGNVVYSNLKNGDPTPDAPKVNPQYGYYHIGWDPVIVDTVNGSATYTARYEKLNNLSYTIKHYWIGDKTQTIREDIVKSDATLGDTITVEVDNAAHIDGYTIMPEQSENSTTITEDSNKVINLYYYKNVTVEAKNYEKAAGTADPTFEATVTGVVGTDNINYTITRPDGDTAGSYTLTPSGNNIQGNYYVVEWKPGTLTIYDTYTVTYKYECTDGSSVPETVTAPVDSNSPYRAGSHVTVLNAPTDTIDGYIFDGWYIGTTKMDGKSFEIMSNTVIIGKWKPVTGLTCTINYIWNGKGTVLQSDTIDGLTYNQTITKSPKNIPGFTPVSEESKNCVVKKDGNVINFYYYMNVKLVAEDDSTIYNGKDYTANVNYDVVTKVNNKDFKLSGVEFKGVKATVTEQNAGSYSIPFNIDPVKDKTVDTNEYYLVTEVVAGTLTIAKRTVTIIGCDSDPKTITYDGKEHTFNDFSVAPTTDDTGLVNGHIVIAKDGKVIYTLTGKDPNTYDGLFDKDNVDIVAQVGNEFASVFNNYNVEYQIGHMTIKKVSTPVNPGIYTEIIVEITGNSDSVVYDGTEHSVKGYTVKISDPRYTEADFTFTGKAEASGINAGTYEMGLKAEQFKNTNARFTNVKFVIKADGVLTITPKDLTITAGSKTEYGPTPVTCDEWTVSGLVAGDKVESVKITGIQSVPGSSPNVPSDAVIKNAKGEDVTKNYAIKYVNGTLTMLEVLNKEDHFNYIIGTPEGLSLPTANVTRAEVATIFFRLMTDDARAKFDSLDNNFSDVAKGKWYNRAISTLAKAGIIKGDPAGTYRPSDPITRAEMAAIIARFGDFKEGGKTFNDISGHWAQKYIELAASNGWINGNPDGTFKPNNNITRAETVAMINRVLDRQTKDVSDLLPVSQMTNWSDNMDTAKWYYRDMQEATNNHKAERVGDSIYEKWTEKLPDIDWASYQI